MNKGITKQDFDLLLEAIEVWEQENTGPPMIAHVMVGMLGDNSDSHERVEAHLKKHQAAADAEKRMRKERGVMLRAKLITLRDSMDAEEFIASVQP